MITSIKQKNRFLSTNRIATLAVLTAMSMIVFMIESLFPPLILPGAKMGLSNIFSLLTLLMLSPVDALICVLIRTTLGSIFVGNLSTLMYSMSAGIASIVISSILVEFVYPRVSIVSVSVVSAVAHNLTQNIVFCLVSNTPQMFSYMPYLALLGVVAGVAVGAAVFLIAKYVPLRTFANLLSWDKQENVQPIDSTENAVSKVANTSSGIAAEGEEKK